MAERKKSGMAPPALGGSSLLVAFAVLALTVFALLSLSTVKADVRLADASAKAVEDYYAADTKAQEILARLRAGETVEGVERLWPPEPSDEAPSVLSSVPGAESGPLPELDDGHVSTALVPKLMSYAVPISDTQELQAEVLVYVDGSYEILRWQAVPVGEWEPDDSLNLWDGIE